jgi:DNA-binding protein HU-beta
MAETINKTTLASKIAATTDLSQAKVTAVLDALFDEVSAAVAAGDKQTGAEIKIAAGHRVKLTAGSKLKAAVK